MFQLNSYHADEQFKWIGKNIKDVIMRHVFTIGAILTFIICGETNASTCFIAAAFLFLGIVFSAQKKEKKKLFARIAGWFKDLKKEFKRVVWPDRKKVLNNTLVVLCVVIVGSVLVGLIDTGLLRLMQYLMGLSN